MTILAVRRIVLVAPIEDRDGLLDALQELGCTHLEPLAPGSERATTAARPPAMEAAEEGRQITSALRVLLTAKPRRRQLHDESRFDLDRIVATVHDLEHRRALLEDERDRLESRIAELSPWGRFRFPDPKELAGLRLWFYEVPLAKRGQVERSGLVWEEVHRDGRRSFIVVVSEDEPAPERMPVPRTHTGGISLTDLEERLEAVEAELDEVHSALLAETRWIDLVVHNVAKAEDRAARRAAEQLVENDGALCRIAGWAPERDLEAVDRLARSFGAVLVSADPTLCEDETPPTLLDNKADFARGGEQLVAFYQIPNASDWDPSILVGLSFALFFAMILADAGYALLLAVPLGWSWSRLGRSDAGRGVRALAAVMLASAFVFGALCGSWFGITPEAPRSLAAVQILDLSDFGSMMRLSVLVGCAHLCLANAIVAVRARSLTAALPNLGWILTIAGGLGIWLGGESLAAPATGAVASGLVLVLVFTSRRAVRGPLDLLLRLVDGALALTGTTRLFGDVLSYLRLFALGLASSSLAVTFNGMADDVRHAVPGLGVFLALLVLLIGHTINLALGVVGGFVHGLRLNFIEFYQWGLGEEGRAFRRFARKGTAG
jgi:V/A-type H+-transporting ATPase subunit I